MFTVTWHVVACRRRKHKAPRLQFPDQGRQCGAKESRKNGRREQELFKGLTRKYVPSCVIVILLIFTNYCYSYSSSSSSSSTSSASSSSSNLLAMEQSFERLCSGTS